MSFQSGSDEVNVEEIMRLIRTRIEGRQGGRSDQEVARLADERIERALDGTDLDTGLLAELSQRSWRWNFEIDGDTLYASTHGRVVGWLLTTLRRWLNPALRLFINPNPLVLALHRQSQLNIYYVHLLHEWALELTRLSLRIESLEHRIPDLVDRPEETAQREETITAPKKTAGDRPA